MVVCLLAITVLTDGDMCLLCLGSFGIRLTQTTSDCVTDRSQTIEIFRLNFIQMQQKCQQLSGLKCMVFWFEEIVREMINLTLLNTHALGA